MSLSGPARAWAWTQSSISGKTWKCASTPIQPDRAWEVKSWGDKMQIIAKFDKQSLSHETKKTWGCKGPSAKYLVKGMHTYAINLFQFFYL